MSESLYQAGLVHLYILICLRMLTTLPGKRKYDGSESGGGSDMYESDMDMARFGRLREEYMEQHPEVSSTGDPTTQRFV